MENRDPINLKVLRRVLLLVFIVCSIFYVGGPPVLAYLFPWEPPVSDEGVDGSVLRVIVPEGEPYEISFGPVGSGQKKVGGTIPDGEFYVDHPVPPAARPSEANDYEISVVTGALVPRGPDERPGVDVPMQAILFVDGEYAACNSSRSFIYADWSRASDGQMSEAGITLCNLTRWYRFFPGYPDFLVEE